MNAEQLGTLAIIFLPASFGLNAWLVHRWIGRIEAKADKVMCLIDGSDGRDGVLIRLARLEAARHYEGPDRRRGGPPAL